MFFNAVKVIVLSACFWLSSCASTHSTLYQEIGGAPKISQITDNLIYEISFNEDVAEYFKNTNIDRFREKLNEHLCLVVDGPCKYTGDSMFDVHKGMQINESHFNKTVELLIIAMTQADIPHTTQNKVLARLVPMRSEITYH